MKKRSARQRMALQRIETLFGQALVRPAFARRYVTLARKLSTRCKVRIPAKWRRRFCRACNAFLVPGKNCRIRTHKKKVVIRCLECSHIARIPMR